MTVIGIVLHIPNKAVGIENVAQARKLLLDVALELLLPDGHGGEEVEEGEGGAGAAGGPGHSHQGAAVVVLQQRPRVRFLYDKKLCAYEET